MHPVHRISGLAPRSFLGTVLVVSDHLPASVRLDVLSDLERRRWEHKLVDACDVASELLDRYDMAVVMNPRSVAPGALPRLARRHAVVAILCDPGSTTVEALAAQGVVSTIAEATPADHWLPLVPPWVTMHAALREGTASGRRELTCRLRAAEDVAGMRAISTAVGLVAERDGVGINAAYAHVRTLARARKVTLGRFATELVTQHDRRHRSSDAAAATGGPPSLSPEP